MLQLDIRSTVLTATILIGFAAVLTLIIGINHLLKGRKVPFYKKRHDRMVRGWRLIILAILLIPLGWIVLNFSEPVVYRFISFIPTTTQTPTLTITPTITLTPTITNTPSITSTPAVPEDIREDFEAEVTPGPEVLFSPLQFSRDVDEGLQPINPAAEFDNPVGHLFGTFSYNNMTDGVQWTALWYWEDELVYYETTLWEGGTGGYGYTDWNPESALWRPGMYEVQLFVGSQWQVSGWFTVTGEPPTATITPSPTASATQTPQPTETPTATVTLTRWPSATLTITTTPTRTRTPRPTDTRMPTPTETP